jgi:hypothetical protein
MPLKWNIPQSPPQQPPKVAATVADLKAGPGSVAMAVVAPKAGPIPVAPGTPVILVAKGFWDSPTIKKLLRVVYAAWLVFAGYAGFEIVKAGDLWSVDWHAVGREGVNVAVLSALAGYGISLKTKDNDPVK